MKHLALPILLVACAAVWTVACNTFAPSPTITPSAVSIAAPTASTPNAVETLRPTNQPTATPFVAPTDQPTNRPASPTSAKPAIQTPKWFNDVVLYEIFPRSFYDTNGDGIGDLKGITEQLDYLQELGVGALWLTPIFESPSYHGYDITDYYKINPEFGTEADLIELVNEAHNRDIKVILDFVAGHSSDQHPFFKDAYGNPKSRYADWYRWLDDAHTKYEHFGAATNMPKWNQDNPETRAYLIDIAKYWMQKAKIDGYRLDYALGVSHDFWKAFRREIKSVNPDALLLGEVWDSGLKIAPYYQDEFDATFDFPVYFDVMGSHNSAGSSALLGKRALASFQSALKAQTRLYPPGAQSVRFLSNHDTLRVMSQVNASCQVQDAKCLEQSFERAKLAATLLMTLPGTPMIYYGEEIGMRGDKSDGDKTLREPMDWYASQWGQGMTTWYRPSLRLNVALDGISVEEQNGKSDSLLEHYRALIALREKYPALRSGEFIPVALQGNDRAVGYFRRDANETIVVLLNLDTRPATIPLDLNLLGSTMAGFADILSGEQLPPPVTNKLSVVVPALTGHVLRVVK